MLHTGGSVWSNLPVHTLVKQPRVGNQKCSQMQILFSLQCAVYEKAYFDWIHLLSLSLSHKFLLGGAPNKKQNKNSFQSPFFPWNIFGQQNHSSRTGRETLQLFVSISAIKFKVLINPLCHYCPWLGVLNVNLMTDRCKQSTMLALSRVWPRWVLKLYNFCVDFNLFSHNILSVWCIYFEIKFM